MRAKQIYQRIVKSRFRNSIDFKIVKIDVSKMKEDDENFAKLLDLSQTSVQKVARKHTPTFLALADNCLIKLRPNHLN